MKNTKFQTITYSSTHSTPVKRLFFILFTLLLAGYSALAAADRQVGAIASSHIEGTGMVDVITNPVLDPNEPVLLDPANPLNVSASPWIESFSFSENNPNSEHGLWVYANEVGRTRTWAYTGTEPASQYGSALLSWRGFYVRDDSANSTFTINPSSIYVFAQTKGAGNLIDENDKVSPPFARMAIHIYVCKGSVIKGFGSCQPAYVHFSKIEGIVGDTDNPLRLIHNETKDFQQNTIELNKGETIKHIDTFCIDVPVGILNDGTIIYETECFIQELGLEYKFPTTTLELDLDKFGIPENGTESYTVGYELYVAVGEDASEHYAEALLGDPLDVNAGGITLTTSHTPIEGNAHYCDLTSDPYRYNNHGDGTVTDTRTGLMWQRCPVGYTLDEVGTPDDLADDLCVQGNDVSLDWQDALTNADSDSSAAFTDWLLPNAKQLESLVELSCLAPTIDTLAFPDTPPFSFWSSTPATESAQAWQVDFAQGDVLPVARDTTNLVRLVRQSGITPVVPTSALLAGRVNVDEGDSGTTDMNFFVALTRSASVDVTVDYETEFAGATEGVDYVATSGTLTIPTGELFGIITVTVNGDTEAENNEQLRLLLSNASVGAYLATPSALGTINDDEPRITVATVIPQQIEGDTGTQTIEFVFTLDTPVVNSITFNYATADDSATAGVDYVAASGNVVMLAGETTASVFVTVNGDTQWENDETFTLSISNVMGGILSDTSPLTAVINDDDGSAAAYQALNDTGVTQCATATSLDICPEAGFPEQDGDLGRDANNDDDSDGIAGFSFTKLDSAGLPITNQAAVYYFDYYTFSLNSSYAIWDCVEDEITGLTWEVKTDVPDELRNPEWLYSWYNSTGVNDGGSAGAANGGFCVDGNNCDTEKYVTAVNASNLCGFNDWRLPRVDELHSLAVYGSKGFVVDGLDRAYFPHHVPGPVWTTTPAALDEVDGAWTINFQAYDSDITFSAKSSASRIRLVRDDL